MKFAAQQAAGGTRRRGAALQDAIFQAVLHELRNVGYARLTMERVATVARTGKAALYRRWANKEDLVVDALMAMLPQPVEPPATGDLRQELHAVLTGVQAGLNATQGVILPLVSIGHHECRFGQAVKDRFIHPRKMVIRHVLERAEARGELRPGLDVDVIADVGTAMLVHRCLTSGEPIPDAYVRTILDEVVLPLVRPAAAPTPPREPALPEQTRSNTADQAASESGAHP